MNVAKSTARAPTVQGDAGLLGHVSKSATAMGVAQAVRFIMKKMTLAKTGQENIRIAVVVVITYGDSLSVAGVNQSDLLGHVDKGSVALIAKEPAGRRLQLSAGCRRKFSTLHQEQIHVAVLIVTDP